MFSKFRRGKQSAGRKTPKELSPEVLSEVKRLLNSGVSVAEISRQLGLPNSTLGDKVKADPKLTPPEREQIELDQDQIDYVHSQLVENVPLATIADDLGLTRWTLTRRCRAIPSLNALLTPPGEKKTKKLSWSEREKIREFARHMTVRELAHTLGRDPVRFQKLVDEDEEIRTYIDEWKTMGFQKSSKALAKEVDKGNIKAIQYYENTRHNKVAVTQIKAEAKTDFTGLDMKMMQELLAMTPEQRDKELRDIEEQEAHECFSNQKGTK